MSHPIEIPQRVQLLDASGQVTGSYVPEGVLQQLLAERDRLLDEIKRLQQTLKQAEADRDRLRRSFEAMEQDYAPLLKRELEDAEKNGVTLGQFIDELERDLKGVDQGNGNG